MSTGRRISFLVVASITGLATFSAWHGATAQPGVTSGSATLKVGVVDLGKLGDALLEAADINKSLMAQRDEAQRKLDEVANELKKATADLEMIRDHTSPEFFDKWSKAAELDVTARARKETLEKVFDRNKGNVTATMYGRMVEGIGLWAQQEGYDLVMVDDRATMPFGDQGSEPVLQMISSRQVLFASNKVDVTSQIGTFMNNRYSAGIRSKYVPPSRNPAAAATGATGATGASGPTGAPASTARPAPATGPSGR